MSSVKVPVVKAKHHLFIGRSSLLRVAAEEDRGFTMLGDHFTTFACTLIIQAHDSDRALTP
jgi:hypothetical protein